MAGIKSVNVRAVKDLPFSPDGTEVVQKHAGDVFACPEDVAVGLKAAGLVEDAGENAEPTPVSAGEPELEEAVISPQTHGMAPLQELSDEQRAELLQSRMVEKPAAQPDISPVEHGGETIDRMLTRGAHPDAVPVEDADTAAQIGKASARAEVNQSEPEDEAAKAAEDRAEEEKALGAAPENKSAAKPGRPRKA